MKLLRIVSVRGVDYDAEAVKGFFEHLDQGFTADMGHKPLMLSATCGDIQGYFTLLIGVPAEVPEPELEGLGNALARAMIGKYSIFEDASYNDKAGQWIMTGTGKDEVLVN